MRNTVRNFILGASLGLGAFAGPGLQAATAVTGVRVDYLRAFFPEERNGFPVDLGAVGGHVAFEGAAPAFVTVRVNGQAYTSPTDTDGNFSFLVYLNGAGQVFVDGWAGDPAGLNAASAKVTQTVKVQRPH